MKTLLGEASRKEWIDFLQFHERIHQFDGGEAILRQGEPVQGIYSIVDGKAKVVIDDRGEERLVRLAANGDILGHRGLGGDWNYPISAIALTPTTVSFIPLPVFHILAQTNANFVFNLMMFFAEELRAIERNQLQMPVLNRVARTLMMNYAAFGFEEGSNRFSYTINRKDIAGHAATTYESVIRTLADLAKRNVIQLDGKSIAILDLKELEVLANGSKE